MQLLLAAVLAGNHVLDDALHCAQDDVVVVLREDCCDLGVQQAVTAMAAKTKPVRYQPRWSPHRGSIKINLRILAHALALFCKF